jgi:hypothetical protein
MMDDHDDDDYNDDTDDGLRHGQSWTTYTCVGYLF